MSKAPIKFSSFLQESKIKNKISSLLEDEDTVYLVKALGQPVLKKTFRQLETLLRKKFDDNSIDLWLMKLSNEGEATFTVNGVHIDVTIAPKDMQPIKEDHNALYSIERKDKPSLNKTICDLETWLKPHFSEKNKLDAWLNSLSSSGEKTLDVNGEKVTIKKTTS